MTDFPDSETFYLKCLHFLGGMAFVMHYCAKVVLGLFVQSISRLTNPLRGQLVKCYTTLEPNTLIFLLKKMREAFALSFSHFFDKNNFHISDINV